MNANNYPATNGGFAYAPYFNFNDDKLKLDTTTAVRACQPLNVAEKRAKIRKKRKAMSRKKAMKAMKTKRMKTRTTKKQNKFSDKHQEDPCFKTRVFLIQPLTNLFFLL